MDFADFDSNLANVLQKFSASIRSSPQEASDFKKNPTSRAKAFLESAKLNIPYEFHAHAIGVGEALPAEPKNATRDRYIYVFRKSGMFEFKIVPGSPSGDDAIMTGRDGACCCCNCCVVEV
jgi:hypothetical protein